MNNETIWACIAAIAIVGIVAMAFIFKPASTTQEAPASFIYDDQNRLQSIVPMAKLKSIDS